MGDDSSNQGEPMTLAPHDTQQPPESSRTQEIPAASAPPSHPASFGDPVGPQTPPTPPTFPPPTGTPTGERPPHQRRSLAQTAGVALLAAVLASGGTYAVTQQNQPEAAPAATTTTSPNGTSPRVVQGNAAAPDWSAVAKAVSPSVVSIAVETQGGAGAGSGVVLDDSGHILTNHHVVEGADGNGSIQVTLFDGRTYAAKIVGTDPSTDLAVLELTGAPSDLTPITLGDSDSVTVGNPVMAIGNPLGLSGTVTTGIVSALDRPVRTGAANESPFGGQAPEPVVTNAIQTSAAINPGNSGGALVNAEGELIGINSAIAQLGGGGQSGNIGIGFAIPVNEAKSIADQLIADGTAEHAFLGVNVRDTITQDGAAKRAGAGIADVTSGTPAAEAGIDSGDVVVAIDGEPVDSSTALIAQIRERTAGDKVTLTVIRDGKRQDVPVTLAAKPATN
jgi:putative serine protease PepD